MPSMKRSADQECAFPGCTLPRFRDGAVLHDYCGRSHAVEAKKRGISAISGGASVGGGAFAYSSSSSSSSSSGGHATFSAAAGGSGAGAGDAGGGYAYGIAGGK